MSFFSKSGARLDLLHKMMERTGSRIDADLSQTGTGNIRSAIISCLACRDEDECRMWLQEVEGEVAPPDFCPNAQRLKRMKGH